MPRYAADTSVPVEKSRAEIEQIVQRYGASEFSSGWKSGAAMIAFCIEGWHVRFILPVPNCKEKRFTHKKDRHGDVVPRTDNQAIHAYEQEVRQRWRAMLLVIKAKLEALECKISTIEEEFMAYIVMPNDVTIGQWIIYQAMPRLRQGQMPLLAGPKQDEVTDAEIVEEKDK